MYRCSTRIKQKANLQGFKQKKVLSVVCSKPKGRQCPARFFKTKRTPSFSLLLGLIADYICRVKGLLIAGGQLYMPPFVGYSKINQFVMLASSSVSLEGHKSE